MNDSPSYRDAGINYRYTLVLLSFYVVYLPFGREIKRLAFLIKADSIRFVYMVENNGYTVSRTLEEQAVNICEPKPMR